MILMSDITNDIVKTAENNEKTQKNGVDFKFFKSCSTTLKRFSVILFVINIFVSVVAAVVGVILIGTYVGFEMLSLLAVPIICVLVIFVVVARLVSALIYGFAEIVETHEKK